jgi:outer membrane protein OmpA-like peptidoglycan-associated protein
VESLEMDGGWRWSVGLFANYSHDPFVVQSCDTTTTCSSATAVKLPNTNVVSDMITWDLLAAVTPRPWVQLGLRLPLSYVNGDGLNLTTGGPLNPTLHAFAMGDPDIEAKFRLWQAKRFPLTLGVAGDISFPAHSTSSTNFIGDASPITGAVRAIAEGAVGRFSYGVNLRAVLREDVTVGSNQSAANTTVGPELRYGAAVGVRVAKPLLLIAEGFGASGFSSSPGTESLEVDGALRLLLRDSAFALTAGGGGGVLSGVGVPTSRVFLGLGYARVLRDRDGDGVPDDVDKCPDQPEAHDDLYDGSGCPHVRDTDGDGIPDDLDKCPTEAETYNGFEDEDGCPDQLPDRDKDGVPDTVDKCPDAGGPDVIRVPNSPYYGCPDRDHDGTPDYLDKCPDHPEATDDLFDGSGCPHVRDSDGDGIPDEVDQCPNEPETYNGYKDEDGCPDKGPTTVEVTATGITIHDRIEFATGKDRIQGRTSYQVLDAVAGVLKGHHEILQLEVQGHTDSAGAAEQNRKLSQKRAEAVVSYLVAHGVEAQRLKAMGYGPDRPIAPNATAAGKQKNRRVEFSILLSAKSTASPTPATPGAPKAPTAPTPPQPAPPPTAAPPVKTPVPPAATKPTQPPKAPPPAKTPTSTPSLEL